MKNENVTLTFSRHGEYSKNDSTPILRQSMVDAFLIGQELAVTYGKISKIYHSSLPRAIATAEFHSLGNGNCPLLPAAPLHEDALDIVSEKFLKEIIKKAAEENDRHILIDTHLPVLLNLGLSKLGNCDCLILQAPSWDKMLASETSRVQLFSLYGCYKSIKELLHTYPLDRLRSSTPDRFVRYEKFDHYIKSSFGTIPELERLSQKEIYDILSL